LNTTAVAAVDDHWGKNIEGYAFVIKNESGGQGWLHSPLADWNSAANPVHHLPTSRLHLRKWK
jgi:hypothetical protein